MNKLLILLSLLTIGLSSCDKCPSEIEISSDLEFGPEVDGLEDFATEERIVFVDSLLNEFHFDLYEAVEGQAIHRPDNEAFCENGDRFKPYYYRETIRKSYRGEDGSIISLSLFAATSGLARREDDILQKHRDFFSVVLLLPDCEPLQDTAVLTDSDGNSNVFLDVPISVTKHGQRHDDEVFGFRNNSWTGDLYFAMRKGLISFNYCGRDWVQKAD